MHLWRIGNTKCHLRVRGTSDAQQKQNKQRSAFPVIYLAGLPYFLKTQQQSIHRGHSHFGITGYLGTFKIQQNYGWLPMGFYRVWPQMPHKYLVKEFEQFALAATNAESLMQHVSERIHLHIPRYNLVGVYLIDNKDSTALTLGPYVGSFTPSPKLSLNQGLCSSAAFTSRITLADNV